MGFITTTDEHIASGGTITGTLTIDGDLQVNGGGSLSFDEILEGTQVIDVTSTEAFLVRKNSDGGDVFLVDTTNSDVTIGGPTTITTAATDEKLSLKGSSTPYIRWYENTSAKAYIQWHTDGYLQFTNEEHSESFYLADNGVGIGHSNPQDTLSLSSSSGAGLNIIRADSAITSGERIGQISFVGTENSHSNFGYGARIEALATEAWTEGSAEGTKLVFHTTDNSSATLDSRMTIDHNGNVGIGTASPSQLIHLKGSIPTILLEDSTNGNLAFIGDAQDFLTGSSPGADSFGIRSEGDIRLGTGGNNLRMTINSSGNVGIGVTPDDQWDTFTALQIGETGAISAHADGTGAGSAIHITANAYYDSGWKHLIAGNDEASRYTQENGRHIFFTSSANTHANAVSETEVMRINESGNVGIGLSTLDTPLDITPRLQVEGLNASTSSISLFRNSNDAHPPYLLLGKSRGTAVNADTVIQDNDVLGKIAFVGADGTDRHNSGAEIFARVDGTPGSDDLNGELVFGTTANGGTSPTERLNITATGEVYIGTDNEGLSINGNTSATGTITGVNRALNAYKSLAYNGLDHTFKVSGTNRMIISSAGMVTMQRSQADESLLLSMYSATDGHMPALLLRKSATNTLGTAAATGSGDVLGQIVFQGHDTDNDVKAGAIIRASADAAPDGDSVPTKLVFMTSDLDDSGSPTTRMVIDDSGKVSIGADPDRAWYGGYSVLQIGGAGSLMSDTTQAAGDSTYLSHNCWLDLNNNRWEYISDNADDEACQIRMINGAIYFRHEGTAAGNSTAVSFKGSMTLDENSKVCISNNDDNTYNTVLGYKAFTDTSGDALGNVGADYNVVIGHEAMGTSASTTDATLNVAVGYLSLRTMIDGDNNTAIGANAATSLRSGINNTVVGSAAFDAAGNDESDNTVIGLGAMGAAKTDGTSSATNREVKQNVAIGAGALMGGTLASTNHLESCVAIGYNALDATGDANQVGTIAIGMNALTACTSGSANTAVGYGSMDALTTGSNNTGLGDRSLSATDDGANNTAVGAFAMESGNCGDNNTAVGYNSLRLCTGGNNTGFGEGTMQDLVEGTDNVAIGKAAFGGALDATADASVGNVFIGKDAGGGAWVTAVSNYNIGIGYQSMDAAMNGALNNVSVGYRSLGALTEGDNNIALGSDALLSLNTGGSNTVIGVNAGDAITTTSDCVLIGRNAGSAINHNDANGTTIVGRDAGESLTDGIGNTVLGYAALNATTTGNYNTVVGHEAAKVLPAGANTNTAIGYQSLTAGNNASTDHNTCVGYASGDVITSGHSNTIIGSGADPGGATNTNETVIGYDVEGQGSNTVTLGDTNVTAVYMAEDSGAQVHCAVLNATTDNVASWAVIAINDGNDSNRKGIKIQCGEDSPSSASAAQYLSFYDGDGGAAGGVRNSSNLDLPEFFEGSDERIKDNIKDTEVDALKVINSLRLREFTKKKHSQKTKIGLVAQEVLKSKIPELVGTTSIDSYEEYFDEGEEEMYTIGTGNMVYYLMKAVQELSAKVEELESKG